MLEPYNMSIHINTATAQVLVEQRKKNGVISRKNISPQSLSECFLTSRVDDERHSTGLLPENCIMVVMERKFTCYFIRYPELSADFQYFDTEYRRFPIPRLVFDFKYLPMDHKVAGCGVCVVKDERLKEDTILYRYPFSNVSGVAVSAWATTPCRSTRTQPSCTRWQVIFCECQIITTTIPRTTTV